MCSLLHQVAGRVWAQSSHTQYPVGSTQPTHLTQHQNRPGCKAVRPHVHKNSSVSLKQELVLFRHPLVFSLRFSTVLFQVQLKQ